MTMKLILLSLMILAIIDSGYMGDKKSVKRDKNVHTSGDSLPIFISHSNRTMLDVYHATDPYSKAHDKRMAEKLHDPNPKNLRQRATYLIENLCTDWYRLSGLGKEETHELLDKINSNTKTNGPDLEVVMRNKLLAARPDFQKIDPEIIRSVVHVWHKKVKRERRIQTREEEADLLFTYYRVRSGVGSIYDRLADQWERFHPHLSDYNKKTLVYKAIELAHAQAAFSPEEMRAARSRYESVFPVSGKESEPIREVAEEERILSKNEEADLLSIYYYVISGKGNCSKTLADEWKQIHPHLSNDTKTLLLRKAQNAYRAYPALSVEEIEAAKVRYESVFGAASGKDFKAAVLKRKTKWTDEQANDLLYLTSLHRRNKLSREEFKSFWRAMHPELSSLKGNILDNKRGSLKRWKDKISLTPQEEAAAKTRLKAALKGIGKSLQYQVLDEQGELSTSQSVHGQGLHQQSPNWMFHSGPLHNILQLNQEELNNMGMRMNEKVTDHPPTPRYPFWSFYHGSYNPTALSRFPSETSHLRSGLSHYDLQIANPDYEHGSSSHSHYNPHTHNPHYDPHTHNPHYDPHTYNPHYDPHSHNPHYEPHTHNPHYDPNTYNPHYDPNTYNPHYDPNTYNPHYEHGSSSYSHYDSHTADPRYEHGNSSHSHDKPHP